MTASLILLPHPRKLTLTQGTFALPAQAVIALHGPHPADLLVTARRAQTALQEYAGVRWTLAGGPLPAALTLTLDEALDHAERYHLTVSTNGIVIAGRDLPGIFYGVMTLVQIVQQHGATLPCLTIEDWPDFPVRGVMLDISRDKVPTMETLYGLIDKLASWKVNQFQLYTEHTFAYRQHEQVWANASPLTAEEILDLDAYCRARHVELVPNQNSFGHMDRWLKHAPYRHLGETEEPFLSPWGNILPPFSFSPAVPETLDLLDTLYDELLPNFTSTLFNVGCDETVDLGLGRSRALVEAQGKGRVYLDFLLEIYERVRSRGYTMQFWGDIIDQYPDLVSEVPHDAIALEWGYEADHDFPGMARLFASSGIPFYVCPGTSSWRTIAGRTDNCLGNIRNAVENGLKNGAIGVLNTDWGDNGHWQTLPISYLGFAYGAALSWAYAPNVDLDLPAVLDAFAFQDRAGVMGRLAYDLGNVYQTPGMLFENTSALFVSYEDSLAEMLQGQQPQAGPDDPSALKARLDATLAQIDQIMASLGRAQMGTPDADLVRREFALAARMLRHGARRVQFQLEDSDLRADDLAAELDAIVKEYRAVWLTRNRPGGLDDSAARLIAARRLFETA